ncbi:MAG: hypothetical protein ACI3XS_01410 [Eubacteriales bacterium]
MDYTVIYEAGMPNGISIPFIVIVLSFIAMTVWGIILFRNKSGSVKNKIFPFIVAAVLLIVIVACIVNFMSSYYNVWKAYTGGEGLVAEGTIENYEVVEGRSEIDYFEVNGVEFSVPGYASEFGYELRKSDGSILDSGVKVRITYVKYKTENVIMKLEVENAIVHSEK